MIDASQGFFSDARSLWLVEFIEAFSFVKVILLVTMGHRGRCQCLCLAVSLMMSGLLMKIKFPPMETPTLSMLMSCTTMETRAINS